MDGANLELAKIFFDAAKVHSGLSMQAWSFHIAGGTAALAWAISTRSPGHQGFSALFSGLIGLLTFGFLSVTYLNAFDMTERALAALTIARNQLGVTSWSDENPELVMTSLSTDIETLKLAFAGDI